MKIVYIGIAIIAVLCLILLKSNRDVENLKDDGLFPASAAGNIEDVQQLVEKGQKIAAIKLYRQIHGVGLKEAKDAVEKLDSHKR